MKKLLGGKISIPNNLELPKLLFFTSTFCSKCLYNRKILQRFIKSEWIKEIDISKETPLFEEIRPRMVPTLVLIDTNQTIIFHAEGILHDETVKSLKLIMSRYLEDSLD